MGTLSLILPKAPSLIKQAYFEEYNAAGYNQAVPAGAAVMRAHALGCGGQGDSWGGGAALARSTVVVTPGENIKVYVGATSTTTTAGDSWVKRNDNTVICYADRGRGDGARGKAANSIGDVTRDGYDKGKGPSGLVNGGGYPAGDADDLWPVFGQQESAYGLQRGAGWGGGGIHVAQYDESTGDFNGYWSYPAGLGVVCLQFFDADPGLGL